MNLCLQLLLYTFVATKTERQEFKDYWRFQRQEWVKRHIVDDAPPGYDDENKD